MTGPVYEHGGVRVFQGDCVEVMRTMEADSIDAIVTDPPYDLLQRSRNGSGRSNEPDNPYGRHGSKGGGFMGMAWDATGVAFKPETWAEALRVAKPGAHLLAMGGTRTYHRLVCAIEDAGWEIRDSILFWGYGSGFPKSLNVSKAARDGGIACSCRRDMVQYHHERSVPGMSEAASEDAAEPTAEVLLADVRGSRQADDADDEGLRGLRQGVAAGDALSGGAQQDLFAGMRGDAHQSDEARPATEAAKDGDLRAMRPGVRGRAGRSAAPVLQLFMSEQDLRLHPGSQPIRPDGQEAEESALRAEQSGVEGRDYLQAEQGQLHRPEVRPLPGGPAADGEGGRLRDGASPRDGAVGEAPADANRSGASSRPYDAEQPAAESGTLAGQPEPQGGGAWPLCPRCGLPIVPDGLGTALKPAFEIICMARKPLAGTLAANVARFGTGGLNIDGCRIPGAPKSWSEPRGGICSPDSAARAELVDNPAGRWPTNLVLSHVPPGPDGTGGCRRVGVKRVKAAGFERNRPPRQTGSVYGEHRDTPFASRADADGYEEVESWECDEACPVRLLDEQSGESESVVRVSEDRDVPRATFGLGRKGVTPWGHADGGGASRFFPTFPGDADDVTRFFYSSKAPTSERRVYRDADEPAPVRHPTVKNLALTRWLVRLVCPPNGVVLDCFAGSGTTLVAARLEGFRAVGVEQDAAYVDVIRRRLAQGVLPFASEGEA